jgi:hypothetical protein
MEIDKACTSQGTLPARTGKTWVGCCIIITIISEKCLLTNAEEEKDRSLGRGQTKTDLLFLQVGGWTQGFITLLWEKI